MVQAYQVSGTVHISQELKSTPLQIGSHPNSYGPYAVISPGGDDGANDEDTWYCSRALQLQLGSTKVYSHSQEPCGPVSSTVFNKAYRNCLLNQPFCPD